MSRAMTRVATRAQHDDAASRLIGSLASLGVVHDYPKGLVIIAEGDASDAVYLVVAGHVQAYLTGPRGRKVVIGVYGKGELVGELDLEARRRCISVVTLEPCRLCLLTSEQFWSFISTSPEAASQLIQMLVRRARSATETIRSLALTDAFERVSRYLTSLAIETAGGVVIERRITQQRIAEHTGCSREMVSRIFKELNARGYIALDRRRITLLRALPTRRSG